VTFVLSAFLMNFLPHRFSMPAIHRSEDCKA
jgi:hypothetical protein